MAIDTSNAAALQAAVDNVKRFAGMYQAVLDLAAILDDVAKVGQLRAEADQALVAKRAELATAQSDLDGIRAQISAANDANAKAATRAQALEAEANDRAATIIADATSTAAGIVQAAKDEAAAIVAKKATVQKAADALTAKIEEAEQALAAKAEEHTGILAKIEEAKGVIAKMMGA